MIVYCNKSLARKFNGLVKPGVQCVDMRGVCGSEETTQIAYVPIGLGGKSCVLRIQVVPGDIPFLLPAYFLSELGAVIDMKHGTIIAWKTWSETTTQPFANRTFFSEHR